MPTADHEDSRTTLYALLAALTDRQLQHIIRSLVAEQPELLAVVRQVANQLKAQPAGSDASPAATDIPVDIAAITREIHKDFRSTTSGGDRYDWYDESYIDADRILQPHIEKVNLLLDAGHPAAAADVLAAVIEQWAVEIANLEDWVYEGDEETVDAAGQQLGALLAEALLSQDLSAEERKRWLARVRKWIQKEVDLEITQAALGQWWDYPPLVAALAGQTGGGIIEEEEIPDWADELTLVRLHVLDRQGRIQEYLNLAKAEGQVRLYLNRLALIGATEQAVVDAQRLLTWPEDALSLAKILDEQGQLAAAKLVAEHGLTLTSGYGQAELAHWTVGLAQRLHDSQLALRAALVAFAWTYNVADYRLVQELAGEGWPALREELLESVSRFPASQQLEIYLYERMLPEVMAIVDNGDGRWLLDQILLLTGAEYPDWSIAHARRAAEPIMEAGKSGAYEEAVAWLRQARSIYLQHNRRQEWDEYLAAVRSRHTRKYKLMGLLREFN